MSRIHSAQLFTQSRLIFSGASRERSRLQPASEFRLVFFPVVLGVTNDRCPDEMPRVPPVIEQNTLREGLTFCRDDDDIMLAHSSRKRFTPVKFERLQLQRIQ